MTSILGSVLALMLFFIIDWLTIEVGRLKKEKVNVQEFDDLKADVAELKTKTASALNNILADVDRLVNKPDSVTKEEVQALRDSVRGVIDSLGTAEGTVDAEADAATGTQDDAPAENPPAEQDPAAVTEEAPHSNS